MSVLDGSPSRKDSYTAANITTLPVMFPHGSPAKVHQHYNSGAKKQFLPPRSLFPGTQRHANSRAEVYQDGITMTWWPLSCWLAGCAML